MQSLYSLSMGTADNTSITNTSLSRIFLHKSPHVIDKHVGSFLWEGRYRPITYAIMWAPWCWMWQTITLFSVVYSYILNLLVLTYIDDVSLIVHISLVLCTIVYTIDLVIHILHAYWPLVRINMRVYRRNFFMLIYDVITVFPISLGFRESGSTNVLDCIGRTLDIARIYRLFAFFIETNRAMHRNRKLLYVCQHVTIASLIIHAGTCFWFLTHRNLNRENYKHSPTGFPKVIISEQLRFDEYLPCWYYVTCRTFNIMFGDAYPVESVDKWISIILMLVGYIFIRYAFIGVISWNLIIENSRGLIFVDRYHHMLRYLHFHHAPQWLVLQAQRYKVELWRMKDGVLVSDQLRKLPLPLQMELIFDINVGHFHQTLLFRDAGESFLRQISLLMRHEIYLEGQVIWCQGIVKNGMICIKRGVIEMLSDEDDESPMIAFNKGTVLGELSLFHSIPAKVTVKAATYVEIQVLKRTDFMRVMIEQPARIANIRKKIDDRLNKFKKRQNAIADYEKEDSRLIRTRYRPMKVLKDHLSGVEDEDQSFSDDSHLYYRDENNERKYKFSTEYLELYKLANKVTTVDSPSICIRSTFPWILEPDTSLTQLFDVTHFILVLYVCTATPYYAIFMEELSLWEDVFNIVVKFGLLVQLYFQLTTAIIEKNLKMETMMEIAEVKMATFGFYLDIISVFPVCIFTGTLDPDNETSSGQIVLLCPVLQFWHIWDYLDKWKKNFYSNSKVLSLLKFGSTILLAGYWAGCFLYLLSCPRKLCRRGSWMSKLIYWETKVTVTEGAKHENQLSVSVNFGTSIISGTGQGDVSPGSGDLIVVVVLIIIGSYLFCFFISSLCSIYMLLSKRKQEFKESMRELFYFLSVNHVGHKIKARVAKFFCVQWYYNNAVSNEEIFKDMSTNIQQEVLYIEMVETLLCCPLFKNCSRDFLQTVAANTRTIVLPDNEIVQHAADITRDMFVLQKGHCNLLCQNSDVPKSEGPGAQFGVVEMLYGLPKVYTVVTTTNCILLHVEYSALVQCLSIFPDVHDTILAVSMNYICVLTLSILCVAAVPIHCQNFWPTLDNEVQNDKDINHKALEFEDAKPLTNRFDRKVNRIKQELKESFVVLTGSQMKENYSEPYEKLGVMRFVKYIILPGCITPHGLFLKIWCCLRFILATFYILTGPYNIASHQHKFNITPINDCCDILLYIDIIVMSYVAYYDERSLLVTHPLLTIKHYLRHAFVIDFLTAFPTEQLFQLINGRSNVDFYRINRILQVFRITGAFAYWESDIMRVSQIVILLKFLPVAVTLVNLLTAFLFMNHCVPFLPTNSSYIMVNCTRALIVDGVGVETLTATTEYLNTFYAVFEMFFGSGSTGISISSTAGFWIVTLLLSLGGLYFGFMYAYVASTRSAASSSLLDHTEKTRDLANFLFQTNVDRCLTAKTLKYFEYVWKRTNGSNPQKICRLLNSALMEDTLVFMYEKTLREVPLFGNVDRSFIRVITQHLTEMYFLRGETVIQCRDVQPYIYIIYRGKVDVLTSYNEMITCMGPGGMFGNFTGHAIACSEVSIYASRSLDLLVIPSQTFFNLIKYYPKIQEPLNKAFERSKDYILPINMDMETDSSDSGDTDDELKTSFESDYDAKSTSSAQDSSIFGTHTVSTRSSQSNLSQVKSITSGYASQKYSIIDILRPTSTVFQTFGYITSFIATCNYIFVLYDLVTNNRCWIITWLHYFFDVYFYMKVFFTLHQTYYNKRGDLVMNMFKCRRNYYKKKWLFWSDLIVNFPAEPLGLVFNNCVLAIHYLRAKKLFRIKYLWEFYRNTASELTNDLTFLQTVITVLVATLLLHTSSCIWLVTLTAIKPISTIRTLKLHLIDDQLMRRYWDYTTSFYVITSEVTQTGIDEFAIQDGLSQFMLSLCLICGKMLAAIVVATSMQVAYSSQHALIVYEKDTIEMIDVLKNQGLSSYQMNKFWMYIQQLWVSERGRQLPALLAQTPYVRRCDLMSAMFGQYLRNCCLFSDTGEPFLRQLAVVLEFTIFFPGNYIVVSGDTDSRMYWVESGSVSVVSVRADLTETTHEFLHPGDVFGVMQGLNRGVAHCFAFRAETKVGILALDLDSWLHILPYFPEAQKIISERAQILFTQITRMK